MRTTIILATALLLGAACTVTRNLDTEELEQRIAAELQAQVGVTPTSVDCPDDVPAEEGTQFECTATSDDGSTATITATVGEGSNVTWEVTSTG
jgi:hypothetical protein